VSKAGSLQQLSKCLSETNALDYFVRLSETEKLLYNFCCNWNSKHFWNKILFFIRKYFSQKMSIHPVQSNNCYLPWKHCFKLILLCATTFTRMALSRNTLSWVECRGLFPVQLHPIYILLCWESFCWMSWRPCLTSFYSLLSEMRLNYFILCSCEQGATKVYFLSAVGG
jgi:hypothetical protein